MFRVYGTDFSSDYFSFVCEYSVRNTDSGMQRKNRDTLTTKARAEEQSDLARLIKIEPD